jgi:glycosyltransferase involved in cell wall biosynthesis
LCVFAYQSKHVNSWCELIGVQRSFVNAIPLFRNGQRFYLRYSRACIEKKLHHLETIPVFRRLKSCCSRLGKVDKKCRKPYILKYGAGAPPSPVFGVTRRRRYSMKNPQKSRLLILVVAYNAEKTIQDVLSRIPISQFAEYEVEALVIDDESKDHTFDRAYALAQTKRLPFPIHMLFNPGSQGYGGNQKIGYHFAVREGFDYVALLHGDGQYAPELLPDLVRPLRDGEADAVFGSRMMGSRSALAGGMPLYKYVGNRILSRIQNNMLGTSLSEAHSGFRAYSVAALLKIPWQLNTNSLHFDTEIIIQLVFARQRIFEIPMPTYSGDEIHHFNGLKYALDVLRAVLKARMQAMGLLYDRRFDCTADDSDTRWYQLKVNAANPHRLCLKAIPRGSRVLDLGCAGGYLAALLKEKLNCRVTGVDKFPLNTGIAVDRFILHDLNSGLPELPYDEYDYILLLDVIEHLASPERFVDLLRIATRKSPGVTLLVSTANIGFLVTRLMLLAGQFNYGKRGILDMGHMRLFFAGSFRRLFEQAGFRVLSFQGVPAPFELALGTNVISRMMRLLNGLLVKLFRNLFSYQFFMVLKPLPSLESLLQDAERQTADHVITLETNP